MTVSIPNDTTTTLLAIDASKAPAKTLWIQNFSLTVGFWLTTNAESRQAADSVTIGEDFFLGPATEVNGVRVPTTFFTDTPGTVQARWLARQNSGAAANLNAGRM